MMNDPGIAWMIAGGTRSESVEERRQLLHRIALAEGRPVVGGQLLQLRQRIAAIVGVSPERRPAVGTLSPDCCPA